MNFLHIARKVPAPAFTDETFATALREFGTYEVLADGQSMTEEDMVRRIRACDVLLTGWGSAGVPACIARDRGQLRWVCHLTGTLRGEVPLEIIEAGIPVTNWGDAPAHGIAEGAMVLLLATLSRLHHRIEGVRRGEWRIKDAKVRSSLCGADLGIYGLGYIGRRFVDLLRPFEPVIRVYDPYSPDLPAGCLRVASLDALFSASEIIVIHAGLTPETRGTVTAERLAMLPDGGVVINTARGGIVDQPALFAELERGRLRAGLDVLEPDWLEPGHPARKWENLILTGHCIGTDATERGRQGRPLSRLHEVCVENVRRFASGQPLQFVMDRTRYERST